MDNKRVGIYSYFSIRQGLDNIIYTTIEDIICWLGCKPDRHKNKTNDNIITYIQDFIDLGYLKPTNTSVKSINQLLKYELSPQEFNYRDNGFGFLLLDEINTIRNFKEKDLLSDTTRIYSYDLLLLFSYLRLNIRERNNNTNPQLNPQCCYRYYKSIASDLNFTTKYVTKLVDILEELGLIICKELKSVSINNNWQSGLKIFANAYKYKRTKDGNYIIDDSYNPQQEINWQIQLLKKNGGK